MSDTPYATIVENARGLSVEDITRLVSDLAPLTHGTQANIQAMAKPGDIYRNGPPNTASNQAQDISSQTVSLVKNAQADITRSGTTLATGFLGYDLKAPAAMLIPFMTPLLNMTPRQMGIGIDVHHWKAVTDFFGGNGPQSVLGAVDEGGAPSYVSRNVVPMSNTFQTIGLQDSLTFKAEWRSRSFEGDLRALLTSQLLYALKLVEENWLINMSDYLWAPPTPLLSASTTGGTINSAGTTYWAIVTATNSNGESLGYQVASVPLASTTTGSITLTIFTVPNAANYNVYVGSGASQPANSALYRQLAADFSGAALPAQPTNPIQGNITATLTSLATSGTAYSAVVAAGNTAAVKLGTASTPLTFQGALALLYNNVGSATGPAVGASGLKALIAQPAASTGYLALSDIQTMFLNMFNYSRANPEYLFVAPQDSITITNLVAANGATRINVSANDPAQQGKLTAGYSVANILNEVTGRIVEIKMLPYLAQGTIVAGSMTFPYPVAGYNDPPFRIITNRDYYGVDYPPTPSYPTQWGFGDYVDETLVNEYLGGWSVLQGIVAH